jgi:hypothetical protein
MLYLFSYAGRIGYVQNTLETLHLPYGTENMYEYTLKENELHGGVYIDDPALVAKSGEDVLIVFVDVDPKTRYPYIPLRKAKLLKYENEQDRMYYTVVLLEHCTPKMESLDNFLIALKNKFGEKLYTKNGKVGKGYLVLYSDALKYNDFDGLDSNKSSWLTAVSCLSQIDIFKKNHCIFTMLTVGTQKKEEPLRKEIQDCGDVAYDFNINTPYCAELDYYVPFHNKEEGTVIDVQFCSSPSEDSLTGSMLIQKLNLEQGKVKFKFIASTVGDLGEIAFKIAEKTKDVDFPINMASKGASFFIKRSIRRYVGIVAVFLISFGLNLGSLFIKDAVKETLGFWYYISSTALSVSIPISAWFAAVLWNGKKK